MELNKERPLLVTPGPFYCEVLGGAMYKHELSQWETTFSCIISKGSVGVQKV